MGALREEATAIRRNLEEIAADRALGLIDRAQMLAATERANLRLGEIEAEVEGAARENVLTPLVAAENAASAWEGLDYQPQARRHQDADDDHAALAGPGRAPCVRPGHHKGHLAAELISDLPNLYLRRILSPAVYHQ